MKYYAWSTAIVVALYLFLSLSACKDETDTEKPTIDIESPANNDTIVLSADSIHIEFTAADPDLHEVNSRITQNNGTVLYNDDAHVHTTVLLYHKHFMPNSIATLTPLRLIVSASDHSGNLQTDSISFFVTP